MRIDFDDIRRIARRQYGIGLPLLWLVVAVGTSGAVWRSIEFDSAAGRPPAGSEPVVAEAPAGEKAVRADLPDFDTIQSVAERKRRFVEFMRPIIVAENARVFHDRLSELSDEDWAWLQDLARRYRVEGFDLNAASQWATLIGRVDIVPTPLALMQAANESAWGTSRFARQGNGLFGQWSFNPGTGMVPKGRPEGSRYEVARFETVNGSVRSYLHNLNTHRAYTDFRKMRMRMREAGEGLNAHALASGLLRYSERRESYVEDLRAMLRANRRLLGPA